MSPGFAVGFGFWSVGIQAVMPWPAKSKARPDDDALVGTESSLVLILLWSAGTLSRSYVSHRVRTHPVRKSSLQEVACSGSEALQVADKIGETPYPPGGHSGSLVRTTRTRFS